MNTSAHVTSSCRTCWALGDFRSRVMLRLLRLLRCHWYGSSAAGCGGILCPNLQGSPFGGSTLMTWAPKSDRITAAAGAATKLEKSTTLKKMLSVAAGAHHRPHQAVRHRIGRLDKADIGAQRAHHDHGEWERVSNRTRQHALRPSRHE